MSATSTETVTVDREALWKLLLGVDTLGDVEHLPFGRDCFSTYADHIWRITQDFRATIDPRYGFDATEEEMDAEVELRKLQARHLFHHLVIEDVLPRAR